jgi:hypothetical protein
LQDYEVFLAFVSKKYLFKYFSFIAKFKKKSFYLVLFWPFVTSKNEPQIVIRELFQRVEEVRSGSQWFAAVRL